MHIAEDKQRASRSMNVQLAIQRIPSGRSIENFVFRDRDIKQGFQLRSVQRPEACNKQLMVYDLH